MKQLNKMTKAKTGVHMQSNKINNKYKKELSEWLEEARRLRSAAVESECDFFEHLEKGERNRELWAYTGHVTFESFLNKENICKSSRYADWKAAVRDFGKEMVRTVGYDSIRLVCKIPENLPSRSSNANSYTARDAVIRDLQQFKLNNRTPPSTQQARSIIKKHWESPSRPVSVPSQEVIMLKRTIAKLKKENARLRAENDRLKAKFSRAS